MRSNAASCQKRALEEQLACDEIEGLGEVPNTPKPRPWRHSRSAGRAILSGGSFAPSF
jgi:hypothetical protein